MTKDGFELLLTYSLSEKGFITTYGQQVYSAIKQHVLRRDNFTCKGCWYRPSDDEVSQKLFTHIMEINQQNPVHSPAVTLCKACHNTQHVDYAILNKTITLVNSIHSQGNLISIGRSGKTQEHFDLGNIRKLKKTPEELLQEMHSGVFKAQNSLKLIYNQNFIF